MSKKKLEVPLTNNTGLHMEFLDVSEEQKEEPKEVVASLTTAASIVADCNTCEYGPPERRVLEECDWALRRGSLPGCTKYVRKI